jgi:hypothetical protein
MPSDYRIHDSVTLNCRNWKRCETKRPWPKSYNLGISCEIKKLRGLSPQARIIPTEPSPLVGKVSANFSG